jgi:formylmethanofuran dehydrogenase subunit C
MPFTDAAVRRMETALRSCGRNTKLIKIIHGYGSSGAGGKIRTAVQSRLRTMKTMGQISDYIPGEEFSMFGAATQKAFDPYYSELTGDKDYGRNNSGITIVILKR